MVLIMENHILKGLFVALMILVMTNFNTFAAVIVAWQQEIRCECTFDYLHKSSTSTDEILANSINTHLTIGCNTNSVSTEVTEYALWKVVDGNYVNMVGVKLRELGPGRYSLSADYSENPDVVITYKRD